MTETAESSVRSFDIRGMTCAACSARLERVLKKTPGILDARVNLALERADIAVEPAVTPEAITAAVDRAGFSATLRSDDPVVARAERETREAEAATARRRTAWLLAACALLTLPFVIAMVVMMAGFGHILPAYIQLVLATSVQILAGRRFYRGAWNALRGGGANMDVLVSLGTTAAWGFSVYMMATVHHMVEEHLYFEASAVVLTLVLLGKFLEERAKASTTRAVRSLMALRPETATKLAEDGSQTVVPVTGILPGDRVLIRPGERVPVDGRILTGESHFDEAVITGESMPVRRAAGEPVVTGAVNGEGAITVEVGAVGEESTLGRITRLVENAQSGKAPVQRLVDRIAAVFVPTVVAIAAAAFVLWLAFGGTLEQALAAAVAVLVIACPCALGLATPTALVAGTGAAARAGILIKDIEVLERAAHIGTVVFDKTGTLTVGHPELQELVVADGIEPVRLLAVSAGAQAGSEHPLARATLSRATADGATPLAAEDVKAIPGKGLAARVGGVDVLIGTAALLDEHGIDHADIDRAGLGRLRPEMTLAYVAESGRAIGLFGYADALRPEAPAAVTELRQRGIRTLLLTGDRPPAARAIAGAAGLDDWRADVLPEGKAAEVVSLRAAGGRLAMVGDGVNDAPALAAADVGIAMGSGTDVAMETAGITLMRPDPRLVAAAFDIAAATSRKIHQNLFWAFIYNIIGIPLAAFGLLTPALAGAAMAMSSVSVVTNAGLLTRWTPKLPPVGPAKG
ncbi:heavy metal translocating P-type ATPase [Pleomorphomonas sp. PLEO]|uniref:heavy metal translocating P-type ATPase n=1 Tax=Pleomorphomonas sp. PLEO TaxID=3239306 RepID=UPI00351E90D4